MLINIILIIVIIITGLILASYNKLVRLNNRVKQTESDIDVLLNQRFDLLPNLIETVKGYSKHESKTLEELAALRSSYLNNDIGANDINKVDNKFNSIFALSESYPELKADSSFLNLQDNLKEIEDKLSFARTRYNSMVTRYNNAVEAIPDNIVAKTFGFEIKELFKTDKDKTDNIQVDFK